MEGMLGYTEVLYGTYVYRGTVWVRILGYVLICNGNNLIYVHVLM